MTKNVSTDDDNSSNNEREQHEQQQRLLAMALGLVDNDSEINGGGNDNADETATVALKVSLPPFLQPLPQQPAAQASSRPALLSSKNSHLVYPISSFPPLSAFDVSMRYHAIIVSKTQTHQILKRLNKRILLHRPRLRVVFDLSDEEISQALDTQRHDGTDADRSSFSPSNASAANFRKIVLKYLVDNITDENDHDRDQTRRQKMRSYVESMVDHDPSTVAKNASGQKESRSSSNPLKIIGWTEHTISLSYDDWTSDEVLKCLLPHGCEVPSSMEQIGQIAHLNLRDELLPYKYIIGKVLLDKNRGRISTIVNKIGTIETEYRTFGMEVIAGNDLPGWSEVVVKEEGCSYHLDFQHVYWNSRLGREHQRIVQLIRKDHTTKVKIQRHKNETGAELAPIRTIVADMMAGIGPFAIPLTADSKITSQGRGGGKTDRKLAQAKDELGSRTTYSNGIVVYANDLNPDSYKYLVVNAEKNRCDVNEKLHTFNMDARAFCHKLQDDGIVVDHFIMNLPKTALEFLDAFRGYNVVTSTSKGADGAKTPNESGALPMIHVHCFASKDVNDSRNEIWGRCETALGCTIDQTKDQVTITEVRDVSPNKNMYCVSFRLPSSVRSLPRIVLGSHNNKNKSNQMDVDDGRSSSTPEPKRSKLS